MTPLFPAQRAAEEFDHVLNGTSTVPVDTRNAQLLATVEMLRAQPQILPRADFVADLRSRLMTAAATEMVRAPAAVHQLVPRPTTTNRRRLGTVAATLVIVGGSTGMAVAASGALPGDPLYPVKRGIEQAQAAAHLDQAGRGTALLDQAATRLDEVRRLQASSAEPELVDETLQSFRAAAESGSDKLFTAYQGDGDTAHVEDVRTFTSQHIGEISELTDEATPQTSATLIDAADTMADIDQQARFLCGACGPRSPVALPGALTAGAGALTLDTLLARPVVQARADIAVAEAELDASIQKLQSDAEKEAGEVPTAQQLAQAAADARVDRSRTRRVPVSSTITPEGELLPALTTGNAGADTAVKDLVTGLTRTLKGATAPLPKTGTPLDDTLEGLDKQAEGLLR